jgi:hypothetical protein
VKPVDRADMLRRLMRLTAAQIEEIEARLSNEVRNASEAEREAKLIGALAKTLDVIAAATKRGEEQSEQMESAVDLDALRTEIAERLDRLREGG